MKSQQPVERLIADRERKRTRDLAMALHLEVPAEWTQSPTTGPDEPIHVEGVLDLIGLLKTHYPDLDYEIEPDTFEHGRRVHHVRVKTGQTRADLRMG